MTAVPMLERERTVIDGVVERGDARGRTIGFPTANVAIGDESELLDGVYAAWVEILGVGVQRAAVNIGTRPTFYRHFGVRLLEAHLLDFDDDLYGYRVRVFLIQRLRSETTFRSVDDLRRQLEIDCGQARAVLADGLPPDTSS